MKLSKKHRNWDSRIPARDEGFTHVVSVPWKGQSNFWWNEACADIMDVFGLPGNKYTSHPTENKMDFYFRDERDAFMCKMLISDRI